MRKEPKMLSFTNPRKYGLYTLKADVSELKNITASELEILEEACAWCDFVAEMSDWYEITRKEKAVVHEIRERIHELPIAA